MREAVEALSTSLQKCSHEINPQVIAGSLVISLSTCQQLCAAHLPVFRQSRMILTGAPSLTQKILQMSQGEHVIDLCGAFVGASRNVER